MKSTLIFCLLFMLAMATPVHAKGEAKTRLMVQFVDGLETATARGILMKRGSDRIEARHKPGLYVVEVPRDLGKTFAKSLRGDRRIRRVEPDLQGRGGAFKPTDALFPYQWHLEQESDVDLDAIAMWSLTRGSPNVTIAILDSGLDLDYPEWVGRLPARDLVNGVDDDGNGYLDDHTGWDFVDDSNDPTDRHGHGTRVTATMAANTNDIGIVGVDFNASLLPVRILDENNRGFTSDLIDALYYAADSGADVINMSLVEFPESSLLSEALEYARDQGSILVACAGNDGPGTADSQYPGAAPTTISVGSTDRYDQLTEFSSTGNSVDLTAPGSQVMSIDPSRPIDEDPGYYAGGCSYATPMVSGLISLMLSIDPNLDQAEALEILAASSIDLGEPGWDPEFGYGRVHGYGAILEVRDRILRSGELLPKAGGTGNARAIPRGEGPRGGSHTR